jgi:hypothetical protein
MAGSTGGELADLGVPVHGRHHPSDAAPLGGLCWYASRENTPDPSALVLTGRTIMRNAFQGEMTPCPAPPPQNASTGTRSWSSYALATRAFS